MALLRSNPIRNLLKLVQLQPHHSFAYLRSTRSYSNAIISGPQSNYCQTRSFLYGSHNYPLTHGRAMVLHSTMGAELSVFLLEARSVTTQAKAPAQGRQMGAMQVAMLSPGFIYEPYAPREPISFLKRWFTRSGWRRTKDDMILELKNAYAIAKLRKTGYSKKGFYKEAFQLYKEINYLLAHGDKTSLRKYVTENMFSALKNDIKKRETMWSSVYWDMIEPAENIRTLRARLIGVDRKDLNKVFIQLTLEFLTKQVCAVSWNAPVIYLVKYSMVSFVFPLKILLLNFLVIVSPLVPCLASSLDCILIAIPLHAVRQRVNHSDSNLLTEKQTKVR